ncbi:glycosyltransferase family 2 protein [Shewanella holmiensis]|uniref:Glycosyltransferase n=1 Tax=Shewanella holmiensis TaxID=2952222 RepID=A0A9X2WNT8_9GAMM|nr:glycosyltransferase family 2 protein [Shewanella holmiensis]MCT7942580.1 glycosyltransferase [Shewanella holmiensis]
MTPKITVVMPVYNVQMFVKKAIESVLAQTFTDFELIIVNDCATDNSLKICQQFHDSRVRIINHVENKGLAAARNTGIRHALGKYVAFLDSDDMWHAEKLQRHCAHLDANPNVGISFSRSSFMSYDGKLLDFYQMPQLTNIDAAHLLCRNPVGNGSAPVIRRETLNDIRYQSVHHHQLYSCYFDEKFRQSEDIECWLRIVATTKWKMEGLPQPLTYYRLNHGGLSANLLKQLASWEQMISKARYFAPKLLKRHENDARAYQLRYLARQAIRMKDGKMAAKLATQALTTSPKILKDEMGRTISTVSAAYMQWLLPAFAYHWLECLGQKAIGSIQKYKISRDGVSSIFL